MSTHAQAPDQSGAAAVRHWSCYLLILFSTTLAPIQVRAQSPICYAAPSGNDLNDGSYWAFAKADLMACYDALPSGGGTIFFRDSGVKGQVTPACRPMDPPGCGILIVAPSDPNYSRPPAGWRRVKGPVAFIGMAGTKSPAFGHGGQAGIQAGGKDPDHPAIWLSGALSITFENLAPVYACVPARIGIDSTGNRSSPPSASWNLYYGNVVLKTLNSVGCGSDVYRFQFRALVQGEVFRRVDLWRISGDYDWDDFPLWP
jgi:hypothetical protein